jgi:hypothetical protein
VPVVVSVLKDLYGWLKHLVAGRRLSHQTPHLSPAELEEVRQVVLERTRVLTARYHLPDGEMNRLNEKIIDLVRQHPEILLSRLDRRTD